MIISFRVPIRPTTTIFENLLAPQNSESILTQRPPPPSYHINFKILGMFYKWANRIYHQRVKFTFGKYCHCANESPRISYSDIRGSCFCCALSDRSKTNGDIKATITIVPALNLYPPSSHKRIFIYNSRKNMICKWNLTLRYHQKVDTKKLRSQPNFNINVNVNINST